MDFDHYEVEFINRTFGAEVKPAEYTALSEESRYCLTYTKVTDMLISLSKPDHVWARTHLNKEQGARILRDTTLSLLGTMEVFITMPPDSLDTRIKSWDHTCDGMFDPLRKDDFIDLFTRLHIEASIPRPIPMKAPLREILLSRYQRMVREIEDRGISIETDSGEGLLSPLHAFFWFTYPELVEKRG